MSNYTATAYLCDACMHVALGGEYAADIAAVLGAAAVDAKRAALESLGTVTGDLLAAPRVDRVLTPCTACGEHVNGLTIVDYAPRADDAAERALSAAHHAARVAEAEARVSAARRAVSAAEDAARGTYAGSVEWYAMGTADDELRDAERALSSARLARARAERAADDAAAAAALSAEVDAHVSPAAVAAPAACSHWECALMGDACVETGAPAMMPPRAPRRYTARRIAARFFEYTVDGLTPSDDPDDFNVDAAPYAVDDEELTFDSVADMVAAIRRDGVTFDAYGDGMTAGDPDGSQIIDYATGAREAVSWHFDGIAPALLERVIVPAIEAR